MGTTLVNMMTTLHVASGGVSPSFPDTCNTPGPTGMMPIPYPNIAMTSDTASESKKVKVAGNGVCLQDSNLRMSTGDEAGVGGGVASGKFKGKAEFVNFSFDVQFEGKPVARAFDLVLHNDKNTPPFPVVQSPA
jgi:hypothetical protein